MLDQVDSTAEVCRWQGDVPNQVGELVLELDVDTLVDGRDLVEEATHLRVGRTRSPDSDQCRVAIGRSVMHSDSGAGPFSSIDRGR